MRARAAVAPASTANSIIRRFAEPWCDQDHALDPEQRRGAQRLVVEECPDPADAGPHEQVADAAEGKAPELLSHR
jgi:hypothetical protein